MKKNSISLKEYFCENFSINHNSNCSHEEWNLCLAKINKFNPQYSWNYTEFLTKYYCSNNYLRLVIKDDNKSVGVFFIILTGDLKLISMPEGITEPLFSSDFENKKRKKVVLELVRVLLSFKKNQGLKKLIFKTNGAYVSAKISDWHLKISQESILSEDFISIQVDLTMPLDLIKTSIRKSYRSLINKGFKLWDIKVFDYKNINKKIWKLYKNLHIECSGRQTRSDNTWELQYSSISKGEAFLVVSFDNNNQIVGGAFIEIGKDIAMYSVGAYDRKLFNEPIAHSVQMRVIECLKEMKISNYHLGFILDTNDDKLLNIVNFKKGFSNAFYLEKLYTI